MQLSSPDLFRATMERRRFSMARLARYSGCSKSMIGHLATGQKKSCSPALASRISEALDVPRELLFVEHGSTTRGRIVSTARRAG